MWQAPACAEKPPKVQTYCFISPPKLFFGRLGRKNWKKKKWRKKCSLYRTWKKKSIGFWRIISSTPALWSKIKPAIYEYIRRWDLFLQTKQEQLTVCIVQKLKPYKRSNRKSSCQKITGFCLFACHFLYFCFVCSWFQLINPNAQHSMAVFCFPVRCPWLNQPPRTPEKKKLSGHLILGGGWLNWSLSPLLAG